MIANGYRNGASFLANVGEGENWRTLTNSSAEFQPCPHYTCDNRIMVVSVGDSDDPLDRANARALDTLAEAWNDADTNAEDAPEDVGTIDVHTGFYNWTYVCINPDAIAPSVLADIVATRESFDDYPVLDESLYGQIESDDFFQSFVDESRFLSSALDESHPMFALAFQIASDNWFGYSDPGTISQEHVAQSWADAAGQGLDLENWQNAPGIDGHNPDDIETRPYCVVCARPIDFCQGHGEIGDPEGYDTLRGVYGASEYPYAYDLERIEYGGAECTTYDNTVFALDIKGCTACRMPHERTYDWRVPTWNHATYTWFPVSDCRLSR